MTKDWREIPGVPGGVRIDCQTDGSGIKADAGKDPWELAPWDALRSVVAVLAFGARKYGDRNWERGMAWSRLYGATLRHLTAWWQGEARDPETGLPHLAHVACCVLFLLAFELRGMGGDDRPQQGGVS
jgi:hypothetical protein